MEKNSNMKKNKKKNRNQNQTHAYLTDRNIQENVESENTYLLEYPNINNEIDKFTTNVYEEIDCNIHSEIMNMFNQNTCEHEKSIDIKYLKLKYAVFLKEHINEMLRKDDCFFLQYLYILTQHNINMLKKFFKDSFINELFCNLKTKNFNFLKEHNIKIIIPIELNKLKLYIYDLIIILCFIGNYYKNVMLLKKKYFQKMFFFNLNTTYNDIYNISNETSSESRIISQNLRAHNNQEVFIHMQEIPVHMQKIAVYSPKLYVHMQKKKIQNSIKPPVRCREEIPVHTLETPIHILETPVHILETPVQCRLETCIEYMQDTNSYFNLDIPIQRSRRSFEYDFTKKSNTHLNKNIIIQPIQEIAMQLADQVYIKPIYQEISIQSNYEDDIKIQSNNKKNTVKRNLDTFLSKYNKINNKNNDINKRLISKKKNQLHEEINNIVNKKTCSQIIKSVQNIIGKNQKIIKEENYKLYNIDKIDHSKYCQNNSIGSKSNNSEKNVCVNEPNVEEKDKQNKNIIDVKENINENKIYSNLNMEQTQNKEAQNTYIDKKKQKEKKITNKKRKREEEKKEEEVEDEEEEEEEEENEEKEETEDEEEKEEDEESDVNSNNSFSDDTQSEESDINSSDSDDINKILMSDSGKKLEKKNRCSIVLQHKIRNKEKKNKHKKYKKETEKILNLSKKKKENLKAAKEAAILVDKYVNKIKKYRESDDNDDFDDDDDDEDDSFDSNFDSNNF